VLCLFKNNEFPKQEFDFLGDSQLGPWDTTALHGYIALQAVFIEICGGNLFVGVDKRGEPCRVTRLGEFLHWAVFFLKITEVAQSLGQLFRR
jgi:hypothetical protein